MSNLSVKSKLEALERTKELLQAKEQQLLQKAMVGNNPGDLVKAQKVLQNIDKKNEAIQSKSFIIDPREFNSFMGYKDKPYTLSYGVLKKVSYTVPIIRAIISTRCDQVAAFAEPQSGKYSTGFKIQKRRSVYTNNDNKPTKEELKRADQLTEYLLNCGADNNFESDDFDTFIRKCTNDSLTYDQMTFEVRNNMKGYPHDFQAVDASTIRKTESLKTDQYDVLKRTPIMGYYPSHCQIYDSLIKTDYYPWELCFGVRNPTTNIYSNGYGVSEIEMLINTITSMLWSDEYNRRFFSQGSAPKGFFKIKDGLALNDGKIAEFKKQWQGSVAGVYNSHKTPVLGGDIDFVDLQKNNRDMEFSHWLEYLIKLACAIFRIDPAEINFPLSGGAEQRAMFEGNNEARLKHSKDKGLYPLLKFIARKINKFVVQRIDPDYEFVFVGLDGQDIQTDLDNDIKEMANFKTIDEIRINRGDKPLGKENGGNLIANQIWYQDYVQKQQQAMGQDDQGNPIPQQGEEENEENYDENPFEKSFNSFIEGLNKREKIKAA